MGRCNGLIGIKRRMAQGISKFHGFMNRLPLGRAGRWLVRFRKRRGYGIHSPFAFAWVTGVVYESAAYYAYEALAALKAADDEPRDKDLKLLFRVANASEADVAAAVGAGRVTMAYLKAARQRAKWLERPSEGRERPTLLIYMRAWENAAPLDAAAEGAVIVVAGIHATRERREAWRRLVADERVRVSMDLYRFGILFTEARLNKEDYIINYY